MRPIDDRTIQTLDRLATLRDGERFLSATESAEEETRFADSPLCLVGIAGHLWGFSAAHDAAVFLARAEAEAPEIRR